MFLQWVNGLQTVLETATEERWKTEHRNFDLYHPISQLQHTHTHTQPRGMLLKKLCFAGMSAMFFLFFFLLFIFFFGLLNGLLLWNLDEAPKFWPFWLFKDLGLSCFGVWGSSDAYIKEKKNPDIYLCSWEVSYLSQYYMKVPFSCNSQSTLTEKSPKQDNVGVLHIWFKLLLKLLKLSSTADDISVSICVLSRILKAWCCTAGRFN